MFEINRIPEHDFGDDEVSVSRLGDADSGSAGGGLNRPSAAKRSRPRLTTDINRGSRRAHPGSPRSRAWIHRRTTNVIESTFATVRLRTNKPKVLAVRSAGLGMAYKLLEAAQARWRCVSNAPTWSHSCALERLRGRHDHRARRPTVRRVITTGRSTTIVNISRHPW